MNTETSQEYEVLPDGVNLSMLKNTWIEILDQSGSVKGYSCLETKAYLPKSKRNSVGYERILLFL